MFREAFIVQLGSSLVAQGGFQKISEILLVLVLPPTNSVIFGIAAKILAQEFAY